MKAVSTIIPAYNADRFLAAAIDSALGQQGVHNEVIVVDDGSTDDTSRILNRYTRHIQVITQPNAGVSAARNAGVAVASHPILAFLDADDVWLPHKLSAQCRLLESGYDAVGCGLFVTDSGLRISSAAELPPCTLLELVHKKSNAGLNASAIVLRRDLFDRIGGFCELLSTSADWDFAVRVLENGRVCSVELPLVYYRQHDGAMHLDIQLLERDMTLAFERLHARQPEMLSARDIEQGYARLWRILAGLHWHQRSMLKAVRCGLRSLVARPSEAGNPAAHATEAVLR